MSKLLRRAALFLSVCTTIFAQNTGSISGIVTDPAGALIPNANVTLTNQATGVALASNSNSEGAFVFTPLNPATYKVTVEATGFKSYTQENIVLNVNNRIGLPAIVMQVGTSTESITVEAEATQLETVTAERSGVITERQMRDIAINGRSFAGLYRTVPGATLEGAFGQNANFNGQRGTSNNFTVDGQSVNDTGVNQNIGFGYRLNIDSLQEFKVTTNSQAAEFGRNSGAQVQAVTKSGSNQFHGTAWWFKRGEFMNANSYIDNFNGRGRAVYRFMQTGWNLGGPVSIPGTKINGKDKLFFFASQEFGRSRQPAAPVRLMLPTAAERGGDFGNSRDGSGNLVSVIDPTTRQAFVGNVIPVARFNQYGPQMLNWLPSPNIFGNPAYNYETAIPNSAPTFDQVYRVDWNINSKWRLYGRHLNSKSTAINPYGRADSGNNLGASPLAAPTYGWSLLGNLVYTASPTLINDFSFGYTVNGIPGNAPPTDSIYYRANAKITNPMLFAGADPIGLVPNLTFGGVSGWGANNNNRITNFAGLPYSNRNPVWNITDNMTKLSGNHTYKFGIYYEYAVKTESPFRALNGNIDFSRDTANPGDTGHPFANALLGNFRTFDQTSKAIAPDYPYHQWEWFAQDTWKVTRKLTLNYGLRMAWIQPIYDKTNLMANFSFAAYDNSQRVTLNPNYDGSIVNGSGNRFNGMVLSGSSAPRGLIQNRGVHWQPRFGLAYQLDSKTVFRAGGGAFNERIATFNVGYTSNFATNPPSLETPQIQNGNLSGVSPSGVTYRPLAVSRISDDGHVPTVYNFSAGMQRQLPGNMIADVSYVGSLSRHLTMTEPFNYVPFNSAANPANLLANGTTKPSNYYRPYIGYVAGNQYTFGTSANYNALQTSLNKRAGRLLFGATYTWSRALGTDCGHITNTRQACYGPLALDRTNVLSFNYVYDIPLASKHLGFANNAVGKQILDNWTYSGITSMSSGAPANVTYSVTGLGAQQLNRNITGSEDVAPRVVFTCAPKMAHSDKTTTQFINTGCFAPAAVGSQGLDSSYNALRGPGIHQWDMSIFKKITFNRESTYLQLRLEAFNVFNHTQWGTLNTAAQFSAAGQLLNTAAQLGAGGGAGRGGFGALTNIRANSQRIVQIAAKFYF
jgi:hypothetical protein